MPGGLTEEAFEDDPADAVNDDDAIEETEYGAELTPEAVFGALSIRAPVSASVTESEVDFASFPSYYDSALTSVDAAILGSYEAFIGPSLALTPTVGFDYRRARLEVDRYQTEERDSVFFEASLVRNVYAPWGRLRASWRDLVIAEAGVRYEYADLEATSDDDGLDGGDAHSPVVFDAGVTYLPADEIKLSARYGRTFRYPALDEQVSYFGFGTDTLYDDLDPETGHSITLGAEYDDGTAGVSVSPFVTWMTDEIVYDAAAFRNVNAGETLRYGSTVDASYTLGAVTTAAGYRYTRAEVASGANEGNLAPLVPAHSVSGEVSAELPFGFGAGTDVSYTSGYYPGGDEGNDAEMIPGRTTWNARISWTGDFGLTAYFAAKNILDDRTPTNAYYSSFSDATTWYPMPGRTFEAGARWSY
jgi:outer membrane receptor protein involved in Fe transport